ncbi:hypothetical protein PHMEG_00035016, partial [Phytophthora megakarya]
RMSCRFAEWKHSLGPFFIFRALHPQLERFTYAHGGVQSTLDGIYISGENESMVDCSGIRLDSIISSDHIGTPFVVLRN